MRILLSKRRPIRGFVLPVVALLLIFMVLGIYVKPVNSETPSAWMTGANNYRTTAYALNCMIVNTQSNIVCVERTNAVYIATYSSSTGLTGAFAATVTLPSVFGAASNQNCTANGGIGSCACFSSSTYVYCVDVVGNSEYISVANLVADTGAWASTNGPNVNAINGVFTWDSCSVVFNSYVYCAGSGTGNHEIYASATIVGGKTLSQWTSATSTGIVQSTSCQPSANAGVMICVGGAYTAGTASFQVSYASITAATFGTWVQQSGAAGSPQNLPTSLFGVDCKVYDPPGTLTGYVYCIGGGDSGGTAHSTLYWAQVSSTGIVTPWNNSTYPLAEEFVGCAMDSQNGFMVCAGGTSDGGTTLVNNVYTTQLSSSPTTTTTTTVINTLCTGACSGKNNGTANFLPVNSFEFYASQNLPSAGIVDNFTAKISIFSVTMPNTFLYVGIYSTGNSKAPSGTNSYSLVKAVKVALINNTRNQFLHVNPQAGICTSCYYAIGLYTNTTKSNSAVITGSGVSLYETSQLGITEYKNAPITTLPSTFYSTTVKTPNDFMYIHIFESVGTVTSTSTTTVGGTATSTTTTTSTSTVTTLDASFFNQNSNWPVLFFILFLPTVLLIGATRTIIGGLIGFIIGATIGLFMTIIPAYVFTGLVIVVVATGYLANRSGQG